MNHFFSEDILKGTIYIVQHFRIGRPKKSLQQIKCLNRKNDRELIYPTAEKVSVALGYLSATFTKKFNFKLHKIRVISKQKEKEMIAEKQTVVACSENSFSEHSSCRTNHTSRFNISF